MFDKSSNLDVLTFDLKSGVIFGDQLDHGSVGGSVESSVRHGEKEKVNVGGERGLKEETGNREEQDTVQDVDPQCEVSSLMYVLAR